MNQVEKCKNLIEKLIKRSEPPEFAMENYPDYIYRRAKQQLFEEKRRVEEKGENKE